MQARWLKPRIALMLMRRLSLQVSKRTLKLSRSSSPRREWWDGFIRAKFYVFFKGDKEYLFFITTAPFRTRATKKTVSKQWKFITGCSCLDLFIFHIFFFKFFKSSLSNFSNLLIQIWNFQSSLSFFFWKLS